MTKEELTAMAREAGLDDEVLVPWAFEIERFANLVAAQEREACAKICETEWSTGVDRLYGKVCAAAIRERSNK